MTGLQEEERETSTSMSTSITFLEGSNINTVVGKEESAPNSNKEKENQLIFT